MAPTFQGVLGCVQIRIFCSVMIECASNLEGIPCFIPIHCLPSTTKTTVEKIITGGLSTIMKRAETRKWNGKKQITLKTQNIIDPFLSALYNTYSLSAALTYPYQDSTLPAPNSIKFTIDATYIAEGEEDSCKLEVLLHDDVEIVMFAWKQFKREGSYVFLRYKKTTWTLCVKNGNLFEIEYHILDNKMTTSAGEMEKIIGWPKERMSINRMIAEVSLKGDGKLKQLSRSTYKWIKKVPEQYLKSMDMNLDGSNDDGLTLLHVLAEIDKSKYVKCVIEKIKNVDPRDQSGQTPLHRACASSSFKMAKILIRHGADVNAVTENGDSPMMILAAQKKHDISVIKMLMDFNAKRDTENNENMRAVDLARMSNATHDVIKLLRPF